MHKYPFKIAAMICALNEEEYIEQAIRQVIHVVNDVIVVLGRKPWNWQQYNISYEYDRTEEIVKKLAKEFNNLHILWAPDPKPQKKGSNARLCQNTQRQCAIDQIKVLYPNEQYRYCFWLDADEFYTKRSLNTMLQVVNHHKKRFNSFSVPFRFYWRSFHYRLEMKDEPRWVNRIFRIWDDTHYREGQYNKISSAKPNFQLQPYQAMCHHMTTCRTAESMKFKICTRAYAENRVPKLTGWYTNVFLKWGRNRALQNLHPTNPPIYKRAIRLNLEEEDFPEVLKKHPYYNLEIIE